MSGADQFGVSREDAIAELERRASAGDAQARQFVASMRQAEAHGHSNATNNYVQATTVTPNNPREKEHFKEREGQDGVFSRDPYGNLIWNPNTVTQAPTNLTHRDKHGKVSEYFHTAATQASDMWNNFTLGAHDLMTAGLTNVVEGRDIYQHLREDRNQARRLSPQSTLLQATGDAGGMIASVAAPALRAESIAGHLVKPGVGGGAAAIDKAGRSTGVAAALAKSADKPAGRIAFGVGGGTVGQHIAVGNETAWDLGEFDQIMNTDIGEAFGAGTLGLPMRYFGPALGLGFTGAGPALQSVRRGAENLVSPLTAAGRRDRAMRILAQDTDGGRDLATASAAGRAEGFRAADTNAATQRRTGTAVRYGGDDARRLEGELEARKSGRAERQFDGLVRGLGDDGQAGLLGRNQTMLGRNSNSRNFEPDAQRLTYRDAPDQLLRYQDDLIEAQGVARERGYNELRGSRLDDVPFDPARAELATTHGAAKWVSKKADELGLMGDIKRREGIFGDQYLWDGRRRIPERYRQGDKWVDPLPELWKKDRGAIDNMLAERGILRSGMNKGQRLAALSKERARDNIQIKKRERAGDRVEADDASLSLNPMRLQAIKRAADAKVEAQKGPGGDAALMRDFQEVAGITRRLLEEFQVPSGRRPALVGNKYHEAFERSLAEARTPDGARKIRGAYARGQKVFTDQVDYAAVAKEVRAFKARIAKAEGDTRFSNRSEDGLPSTRQNVAQAVREELHAYRLGAMDGYQRVIQSRTMQDARTENPEIPRVEAKLRALFDNDQQASRYMSLLRDERIMKDTENIALRGSQTARNQATDQETIDASGGRQFDIIDSIRGGINDIVANYILRTLGYAKTRFVDGITRGVADELAKLLSRSDLDELAKELRRVEIKGGRATEALLPPYAQRAMRQAIVRHKKGSGSGGSGGGGLRQKRYSLPPEDRPQPPAVQRKLDEAEELRRGNDATKPPPRDVPMQESRGVTPRDAAPQPPQLRRGPWSDEDFDAVADMAGGPGRTVNRGGKPAQNMPVNTAIHHLRRRQSKAVADERAAADLESEVARIRATRDRMGQTGASLTARSKLNVQRKVAEAEAKVERLHGALARGATKRQRKRIEARLRDAEKNLAHWRDEMVGWAEDFHDAARQHRQQIDKVRAERDHWRNEANEWADDAHATSRDVDATRLSEVEKLRAENARLKAAEERALVVAARAQGELDGEAPKDFDLNPSNMRQRIAEHDEKMRRIAGDPEMNRNARETSERLAHGLGGEEPYIRFAAKREGEQMGGLAYDPAISRTRAVFEIHEDFLKIKGDHLARLSKGTPEGYRLAAIDEEVAHRMFDINNQLPPNRKIFTEKDLKILRAAGRRMISEHKAKTGVDLMERYKHMPREIIEEEHAAKFLARGALNTKPDKFTQRVLDTLSRAAKKLLAVFRLEMRGADLPTNREAIAANKMADRFRQGGYSEKYREGTSVLFGD